MADQTVASKLSGREVVATGRISDDPEATARQVRFEVEVSAVLVDQEWRLAEERWLVHASPSQGLVSRRSPPFFRYGDEVTVRGIPLEPQPFEGFDYASYLTAQGITATMFAREARVTGRSGTSWRSAIFAVRGQLAESIERAMPYPESALASRCCWETRGPFLPIWSRNFAGLAQPTCWPSPACTWAFCWRLRWFGGLAAGEAASHLPHCCGFGGLAVRPGRRCVSFSVEGGDHGHRLPGGAGSGQAVKCAPCAGTRCSADDRRVSQPDQQVSFQLSFAAVGGIALALVLFGGRLGWLSSPTTGWAKRLLAGQRLSS